MSDEHNPHPDIPIPIDSDEADSAFGDDESAGSTASVTDSIRDYRILHGRTFHNYNDSVYWGPNDEAMNEYLDIAHHMLTMMQDGELFLAPIGSHPQKVLDVGTGTGIWAIDFADRYPSAEVIGTDLSPTQPQFVPPNLRFELDDAQQEWTYKPDSFDYIHIRCLLGAIGDWPALYEQVYKCTKPGGWIEHLEISIMLKSEDGTVDKDHFMAKWSQTLIDAAEMVGKSFQIYHYNKKFIEEAGFVDVVERKFKVPVGSWSSDPKMKELGQWNRLFCLQGLESWCIYLLSKVLKWEYIEIQTYIGQMRHEILSRKNHAYYDVNVVYGRKPGGNKKENPTSEVYIGEGLSNG